MGLVNTPWAICDEPGAWETVGGQLPQEGSSSRLMSQRPVSPVGGRNTGGAQQVETPF